MVGEIEDKRRESLLEQSMEFQLQSSQQRLTGFAPSLLQDKLIKKKGFKGKLKVKKVDMKGVFQEQKE